MKTKSILLSIILFCTLSKTSIGQTQRFNAGIIAGLNFSELEGEGLTDYFGLNVGIIGTAKLSKHNQIGIEFLFSQNGEYILPEYYPPIEYGTVWLNHIEIPIHYDWLIQVLKNEKKQDLNINLGIAYTRILGFSAEDSNKNDVSDQIIYKSKEAFLLQTGLLYNFTDHVGLNLKASLPLRKAELDWTLAARIIYTI